MLVAITGASGFIGSYIVASLARAGHEVRALVRPTSRRDHISQFVADFRIGDFSDPQAAAGLCAGVDVVIHDAVDWSARERSHNANFEKNVMGSLRLLESARQAYANQFIFISSVSVYHEIPASARGIITEETVAWPDTDYGAYKASIESHLKAYHFTYGMNASAWRPAAVYGLNPTLKNSQWYNIVKSAKTGGTVSTDRGGKITHVQDIADAMVYAIDDASVSGQIYNLVDTYIYWQQAGEIAKDIARSNATIEDKKGRGPQNQFDCAKAIDFFNRHGNTTALRRGINGVREYIQELLPRI